MLDSPELGVVIAWQASTWREEGSWNQTVLALPLAATPMGTKLGAAWTCDRANGDMNAASMSAKSSATT